MAVTDKQQQVIDLIKEMNVLEVSELVKALEEVFGVTAAAPMGMMAAPVGGAAAGEPAEEKSEFDVELTDAGAQKINVIKAVREIEPKWGLKEAKDLVEAAPKLVLEKVKKDKAEEAKAKLEAAGAKVTLK